MQDLTLAESKYDFSAAHAALQRCVDQELLAGASMAVLSGRDLIDLHCAGWADKEAGIPLGTTHIFRIFSNTKLITSCALLLMFEQGLFDLDDPIEKFIPELGNRQVLKPDASAITQTEAARSPITIRHLMTHSAGLSYGIFDPGTVLFKAYNEQRVLHPGATLQQMITALSGLPLAFHPGTGFEYSVATDVLSRLVEILSGQRFDEFIQARIFNPLGMQDTGFTVPAEKQSRLTRYYAGADLIDPFKPGLTRTDDSPYPGAYLRPVPKLSGGGGLVSTLPDTLRLLRSLMPGEPSLLKPETMALMRNNHLPNGIWLQFARMGQLTGRGHGLAGGVVVNPSPLDHPDAAGEFYWGGVAGTQWWISPRHNIAGLIMTQRQMAFAHPFAVEVKRLVYQAISEAR